MRKTNHHLCKGRIEMRNNKISKDGFCSAAVAPYKAKTETAYPQSAEIKEAAVSIC
jgi:hypothetical protein